MPVTSPSPAGQADASAVHQGISAVIRGTGHSGVVYGVLPTAVHRHDQHQQQEQQQQPPPPLPRLPTEQEQFRISSAITNGQVVLHSSAANARYYQRYADYQREVMRGRAPPAYYEHTGANTTTVVGTAQAAGDAACPPPSVTPASSVSSGSPAASESGAMEVVGGGGANDEEMEVEEQETNSAEAGGEGGGVLGIEADVNSVVEEYCADFGIAFNGDTMDISPRAFE